MMRNLWKNRAIRWNSIRLMAFCLALICAASIIISGYAKDLIRHECEKSSESNARELLSRTEEILRQTRGMAAYLATQPMAQSFFTSASPGAAYDNFYDRLTLILDTYVAGIDYIDSVYLYSPVSDRIMSTKESYNSLSTPKSVDKFSDTSWLERLDEQPDGFLYFIRNVYKSDGGFYPFVLTVLLHRVLNSIECVVAINIDLQSLYNAVVDENVENEACYLINTEGQVFLQRVKYRLYIETSDIPHLSCFDPFAGALTRFMKADGDSWIYTQLPAAQGDFFAVSVSPLSNYEVRLARMQWIILAITLVITFLSMAVIALFSTRAYRPVKDIVALLESPDRRSGTDGRTNPDFHYISEKIMQYLQTNEKLKNEMEVQLQLLNQTQVKTLQLQISPHFLYNTLNLIGLQVSGELGEDYVAVTMLEDLALLLRYSLESTSLVPLSEEQKYTLHYIHLLSARYQNTFNTVITLADDILNAMVPRLLLQPLIENAVFHGVSRKKAGERGRIAIEGTRVIREFGGEKCACVKLTVTDNGNGIAPDMLKELRELIRKPVDTASTHIGVQNVSNRLKLLYQQRFYMSLDSELGKGTCITLIFPIE